MDLPIKFPSDGDVIREEVARFRALSPEERIEYIQGMIAAGAMMMRLSPSAEYLRVCSSGKEPRSASGEGFHRAPSWLFWQATGSA